MALAQGKAKVASRCLHPHETAQRRLWRGSARAGYPLIVTLAAISGTPTR
jgi:hypothetical protein